MKRIKPKKTSDTCKKKTKQLSFLSEYKLPIFISCAGLVIAYVIIYLDFVWNGFLPAGLDLEKKDWLSFLGSYLSFAGTAIVSLFAIFQSRYFTEQERKRIVDERKKTIQPILSIEIAALNSHIDGTAEVFNPSKPETLPVHRNVTIVIENVGSYPIRNVIVFDKYKWQLLKPNEKKRIQVAYSDSPDAQRWKKYIIEISESDYEKSDEGIPMWFNVNYDDVDGNEMYQTYVLKKYEGTPYYSLERICET